MSGNEEWTLLGTVASEVEAHVLEGVLKTHGIPVRLEGESASRLFGITTGALGGVRIYVPIDKRDQAEEVLDAQVTEDQDDEELPSD